MTLMRSDAALCMQKVETQYWMERERKKKKKKNEIVCALAEAAH